MTIAFIIGGGWWLLFNMYHYGISEAILSKTLIEVTHRNARVELENLGYAARGLNIKHLLILNAHNFITETYLAFVANMDWLRIKVASYHYGFYLWIVVGIVLNGFILCYQTVQFFVLRFQRIHFESFPGKYIFEILLYSAILMQIYFYTNHNVKLDIQIQGKYLMTMFVPMTILGLSFYGKVLDYLRERFEYFSISKDAKIVIFSLLMVTPVLLHLDALFNYVIPFYWPTMEFKPF